MSQPHLIIPRKRIMPEKRSDKLDMVVGLREVAKAIEQGHPDYLITIQAIATELLVFALKLGPAVEKVPSDDLEALIRREITAIVDSVVRFHEGHIEERDILEERLFRLFDPSLAFNEAVNRAIERKKAAREEIDPALLQRTPQQDMMWKKFQLPTLEKALRNA